MSANLFYNQGIQMLKMAIRKVTSGGDYHHHIVALEAAICPIPEFSLPSPYTYDLTTYPKTTQAEIPSRIRDATILITTTIALSAAVLSPEISPNLRLIAAMATGTNSIDLEACKKRGIIVCNCAGANVASVAEHAIGMYFTARRKFIPTHYALRADEWVKIGKLYPMLEALDGTLPLSCREEVMGLIGYGVIGKLRPRSLYGRRADHGLQERELLR